MMYAEALSKLTDATKKITRPEYGSKYLTRNFESAAFSLVMHDGPATTENWYPPLDHVMKNDWKEV